jgi:proteasome beta subunit
VSGATGSLPGAAADFGLDPSFASLVRRRDAGTLPAAAGKIPEGAEVVHGTTVLGLRYADGVIVAGDRRATSHNQIADDRMRKVFPADDYSAIAIAGAAGRAIELVKLFQLELEHYEKLTGDRLSLEGKANRLSQMIRDNFPMMLQGLGVVPLFGGFDERQAQGRLYRYDVTGGRWEESDYQCTGSGSQAAKGSLKKLWRPQLPRDEAIRAAVEALLDASEDDAATGGPDLTRRIYPNILTVTAVGAVEVPEDEIAAAVTAIIEERI